MLSIHPGCWGLQHWSALPQANVDERCVWDSDVYMAVTEQYEPRAAHAVPGYSFLIQRFCLAGANQVHFGIIGTCPDTTVSPVDTLVGGHHKCGCVNWVRTVGCTSGCRLGWDVCVPPRGTTANKGQQGI